MSVYTIKFVYLSLRPMKLLNSVTISSTLARLIFPFWCGFIFYKKHKNRQNSSMLLKQCLVLKKISLNVSYYFIYILYNFEFKIKLNTLELYNLYNFIVYVYLMIMTSQRLEISKTTLEIVYQVCYKREFSRDKNLL